MAPGAEAHDQTRQFAALARLERAALVATRALSIVGLIALMILAFVTLADGVLRWRGAARIAGVQDVGGLAIAIAVCCCMPVALMEKSHITFRLVSSLSPRLGRLLDCLASIAVALVLVLMAREIYVYAEGLAATREGTYVLKLPAAPFWYAADAILWGAVAVQAIVVSLECGRLFGYRSARDSVRAH